MLANGWFTAGQRERAKKFYIEAFEHAQRSFESTRAAGGNGFDEAKLSQAIIRRLTISGMLSEANKLTSLITDDFWREKAKTPIERSGS